MKTGREIFAGSRPAQSTKLWSSPMRINAILARADFQAIAKRFWSRVDRRGSYDCWEWTGRRKKGYGEIAIGRDKSAARTHRLAYGIEHGGVPDDLCVLHYCDNPPCCNPKHLFLGTNRDNIDDMLAKGRSRKGSRHRRAKLTEADAAEILSSPDTAIELAAKFRVAAGTIGAVRTGITWLHVPGERDPDTRRRRGERKPTAKLTEADVRAIRTDPRSRAVIAAEYGICIRHLTRIRARKQWNHI